MRVSSQKMNRIGPDLPQKHFIFKRSLLLMSNSYKEFETLYMYLLSIGSSTNDKFLPRK